MLILKWYNLQINEETLDCSLNIFTSNLLLNVDSLLPAAVLPYCPVSLFDLSKLKTKKKIKPNLLTLNCKSGFKNIKKLLLKHDTGYYPEYSST